MHGLLWICKELGRETCSLESRVGEIREQETFMTRFDLLLSVEER